MGHEINGGDDDGDPAFLGDSESELDKEMYLAALASGDVGKCGVHE